MYVCVHARVHTRMQILLIHNTHLTTACIRVLCVCVYVCVYVHTHVHTRIYI